MESTGQFLVNQDTMNAPWGLESRLKLVALACDFFNATKLTDNPAGRPAPLTVKDFLKHLEVIEAFPRTPNAFRVLEILERMASTGLLISGGQGRPSFAGLQNHYVYSLFEWEVRRDLFRLVPVLGPEFLCKLCAPGLVHITGVHPDGDVASGTGLIVDPSHVLTCRHVVTDMEVDDQQTFQGKEYAVNRCSDLRTSGVVLENIADLGSDYLRTKRPLGSHYLRMSAH